MRFKPHTLAALAFSLVAGAAQAAATQEVHYTSLNGTAISFSELADGALIDGVLTSGGVQFGERFDGQELAIAKAPRPGEVAQDWFDDLSNGTPTAGLTLLAGAAGANLGAYNYGDADGTALFGVGPLAGAADGFGAISARFASPVSALGFQLRDVNGGAVTLSLYRIDGGLIEAVDLSGRSDGRFAFARTGGTADIAGFTLTHRDDYYGVSLDNLVLATAPVPEPASALLLVPGLLTLAAVARRRRAH
ncbi:hypothetical protein [Roseateles sp. LKC17W]|uniref:PEP-CTERM sorting domain-containing protein n=1 Tax=Pelomonas margarita TaxID=3299031 RepID=A0ABW7FEX5_9BURK